MRAREQAIRERVRGDLPPEAFLPQPLMTFWIIPIVAGITAGCAAILATDRWYQNLFFALVVGNLYGCLFFYGHELVHGAMSRSRRLQDALIWVSYLPFFVSPRFLRAWHFIGHHAHTNEVERDTDVYGTLQEYRRRNSPRAKFLLKFGPGSGHWLSFFYPATFALQAQIVLWFKTRSPDFRGFDRTRAIVESLCMLAFWVALGVAVGWPKALWVVVVPLITANTIVMSYGATNHIVRPLTRERDTLATAVSLRTLRLFDLLHFRFSHHVEHHMFPDMSCRYFPLVRESLERHAKDDFVLSDQWKALAVVFATPRLYETPTVLVDPNSGRRVDTRDVEYALRSKGFAGLRELFPAPAVLPQNAKSRVAHK